MYCSRLVSKQEPVPEPNPSANAQNVIIICDRQVCGRRYSERATLLDTFYHKVHDLAVPQIGENFAYADALVAEPGTT